jgi:hypothetical protein
MEILGTIGKAYVPYLLGSKKSPVYVPKEISEAAQFANIGYIKPEKRPKETSFGLYEAQLSTPNVAIYKEPKTQKINVAIRGSDFSRPLEDIKGDVGVLTGRLGQTERYQGVKEAIETAKKTYPEFQVKSISHSLGASTGRQLVKEGVINKSMGFSEGLSPFIQEKTNPNIQSIRFKSDIISHPQDDKGVISLQPTRSYAHGLGGFFS